MPDKYDLDIYRGDTHRWTFFLWADPDKTVPIDLTGITLKSEIRDKPSGATIIPLACENIGGINRIEMTLTAANAKLVPPRGQWDLQLTYPDASVRTFIAGIVKNTLDVTDSTP